MTIGAPAARSGAPATKVLVTLVIFACINLSMVGVGGAAAPNAAPAAVVRQPNLLPHAAGSVVGLYAGAADTSAVSTVSSLVGHRVTYAMDFLDGSSWSTLDDPAWLLSKWNGTGDRMIWGLPMLPNSGASLSTGATGAYNGYFVTLAQRLVAGGQGSSIIRLGWEFNGGWFPWAANGQAAAFVTYWRQIVGAMRSVPGARFSFEWNPTRGDQGVGSLSNYYPGNAYVDYVGLDVYDVEWQNYPGQVAEWNHIVTQSYGLDWLAFVGALLGKPLALPEWGLGWTSGGMVGGGDDAYFVSHMASWIATHQVANAIAWDYGSNPLPSSSEPAARAAFAASFSG